MHDFYCADPDKMYYKELSDKVKSIKENKEEENTMIDLIEEYAEKRAKKAAKKAAQQATYEKSVDVALRCLRKGYTEEEAADLADMPLEEVQKLAEQRST